MWACKALPGIDCLKELRIEHAFALLCCVNSREQDVPTTANILLILKCELNGMLNWSSVFSNVLAICFGWKEVLVLWISKMPGAWGTTKHNQSHRIECESLDAPIGIGILTETSSMKYKLTYEWVCYWIEFTTDNMREWLKSQEHLYRIGSQ